MFKNSGKKIMGFVKFVFGLNVIITILAILGGTIYAAVQLWGDAWLGVFFGGLIVGAVYLCIVYLSMMCLYAFGELVQCNIEQTSLLRMMCGVSKGPAHRPTAPASTPVAPTPAPVVPVAPATQSSLAGPAGEVQLKKPKAPVCPKCGAQQNEGAAFCRYCGTPIH